MLEDYREEDLARDGREERENRRVWREHRRLKRNNELLAWWNVAASFAFLVAALYMSGAGSTSLVIGAGVMAAVCWIAAWLSGGASR